MATEMLLEMLVVPKRSRGWGAHLAGSAHVFTARMHEGDRVVAISPRSRGHHGDRGSHEAATSAIRPIRAFRGATPSTFRGSLAIGRPALFFV
jgi:hypothetical protein